MYSHTKITLNQYLVVWLVHELRRVSYSLSEQTDKNKVTSAYLKRALETIKVLLPTTTQSTGSSSTQNAPSTPSVPTTTPDLQLPDVQSVNVQVHQSIEKLFKEAGFLA